VFLVQIGICQKAGDDARALKQLHDLWSQERDNLAVILNRTLHPLQLPDPVNDRLLQFCLRWVYGFVFDQELPPMLYRLTHPIAARKRRLPKTGVTTIARDINWLYRSEIKIPRDSVSKIAKEYVNGAPRSKARSVVQDGINRAKMLVWSPTFGEHEAGPIH
jgi:hypothetical protein